VVTAMKGRRIDRVGVSLLEIDLTVGASPIDEKEKTKSGGAKNTSTKNSVTKTTSTKNASTKNGTAKNGHTVGASAHPTHGPKNG